MNNKKRTRFHWKAFILMPILLTWGCSATKYIQNSTTYNSYFCDNYTNDLERGYINTGIKIGNIVDTTVIFSKNNQHRLIKCQKNDIFVVQGKSNTKARLWAFLDDNKKLVSAADARFEALSDLRITAPCNGYFIYQTSSNPKFLRYGNYEVVCSDIPSFDIVLSGTVNAKTYKDATILLDNCTIRGSLEFENCSLYGTCTSAANANPAIILRDNSKMVGVTVKNANSKSNRTCVLMAGKHCSIINGIFDSFYNAIMCSGEDMLISGVVFNDAEESDFHTCNIKCNKSSLSSAPVPERLTIENVKFGYCTDNNIDLFTGARDVCVRNCVFDNTTKQYIEIKSYSYYRKEGYNTKEDYSKNILFENCSFISRSGIKIAMYFGQYSQEGRENWGVDGLFLNNCTFMNNYISVKGGRNVYVNNCKVDYTDWENSKTTYFVYATDIAKDTADTTKRVTIQNTVQNGGRMAHCGYYDVVLSGNVFSSNVPAITGEAQNKNVSCSIRSYNNIYETTSSQLFSQITGNVSSNKDSVSVNTFIGFCNNSSVQIEGLKLNKKCVVIDAGNNELKGSVEFVEEGSSIKRKNLSGKYSKISSSN